MNPISIATVKRIREELGATHLVLFAMGEDGVQHVATHGKNSNQAVEAAEAGNRLKTALGWPADLCQAKPLPRQCRNCEWFKPYTNGGTEGLCLHDSEKVSVDELDRCSHFEPKD